MLGELAAVGAALCWGVAASLFVASGRRLGSLVLNRMRLGAALVYLAVTLWILRGSPWPTWATATELQLLAVSALLGFVLGDSLYFRSLVILGAGRAAMVMSLAPVFAATLGHVFLDEHLGVQGLLGMAITLAGLVLALAPRAETAPHREGSVSTGILCGAGAALLSSAGYILSKAALGDGLDALSGTVIRVGAAAPLAWLLAPVQGGLRRGFAGLRNRIALGTMLGGAFFGPFLGVTLSLAALQHTETGVAASIFACFPLPALFLGARFHREVVTLRTVAGALLAIGGVIVLFAR